MSTELFDCQRYVAPFEPAGLCRSCGQPYEDHVGTKAQARRDDPPTAKASAAAMETNAVETNILEVVGDREMAGHEIPADPTCRYPEITTSARLRPMARRGLLDDTGRTKINPRTNRPCIIWRATRRRPGQEVE